MVPFPTPFGLPCPRLGVYNPHPKLQSKISRKLLLINRNNMYGRLTGTHQRFFKCYSTQPPIPQDWGFATPTQNCNLAFRQSVGKFAHRYASTVGSKNVVQKNELSGGASFGNSVLKRSRSL